MRRTSRMTLWVLALLLIFTAIQVDAQSMPKTIYEFKTSEPLSSGAVHEHIKRFTTNGWFNIHVLRMDLKNPTQEVAVMKGPQGLQKRSTVNQMVDATPNAIGGVNGDYFESSPMPSTLGVAISNGEILSSAPHLAYALPAFYVDGQDNGGVTYLDRDITIKNNRTGTVYPVNMINKISADYTTLAVLDSNWGTSSPGNRTGVGGVREVVVVNDTVTEIRDNQPGVNIPENGYVLAVKKEKMEDMQVGDSLTYTNKIFANETEVPFAMGGGSIIVQNGEVTLTNIHSEGIHPRTGIGVTQDQSQLLLVTVDGRSSSFKGIDQKMFGSLMKELGAYQAMNLDGGGSTTMAISPRDGSPSTVVNNPSDGNPRAVVNGVAIVSNDPVGPLHHLVVTTKDDGVHAGLSQSLHIVGYDANHHVVAVDPATLNFQLEGVEGRVEQSVFYPASPGRAKITVTSGNASGSVEVDVYHPIVSIKSDVTSLRLGTGETRALPQWIGVDQHGREGVIPANYVQYEVSEGLGSIANGHFTAAENATSGYIVAKIGNASRTIPVAIGSKRTAVENFETIEHLTARSWPEGANAQISLSKEEKFQGENAIAINYDFTQVDGPKAAYVMLPTNEQTTLTSRPDDITVAVKADGKGAGLKITLMDANNKEHVLTFAPTIKQTRWQTLPVEVPEGIAYPARMTSLHLAMPDADTKIEGTVLLDHLTFGETMNLPTENLPASTEVYDPLNAAGDPNAPQKFAVTVEPKGLENVRGADGVAQTKQLLNNYHGIFFLRGVSDHYRQGLDGQVAASQGGLTQTDIGNTKIVTLNMKPEGIRAADANQWITLRDILTTTGQQQVILVLPHTIDNMQDQMEASLLKELLEDLAKKGRKVFVVQGSDHSSAQLINQVRYITLPAGEIQSEQGAKNWAFLEVTVNESGAVTYAIRRLP